jgi:protein-tyrosine phosphatase
MARAAAAGGTAVLVATPHLHEDFPDVHVAELGLATKRLQAEIDSAGIPLQIVPGGEVSIAWAVDQASEEDLTLASYGQRGTDLLLETPAGAWQLELMVRPFQGRGFRITLAHPERSHVFHLHPSRLARLAEQDVLLQLDADALLADPRSPVRRLAERLCRSGLATVIASDGHSAEPPRSVTALASALEVLAELVGPERARWMAIDAPRAIVEGEPLPKAPSVRAPSRWRRFGRPGAGGARGS